MSGLSSATLDGLYRSMQSTLPVAEHDGLGQLVHSNGNKSRPIHRWFRFKEGFSAELLSTLVSLRTLRSLDGCIFDPFCGSGTSLLAADLELGLCAKRVGVEVNPFIAWVAQTKLHWRDYDVDRFRRVANRFLSAPLSKRIPLRDWPVLSSFHNERLFDHARASQLIDAARRAAAVRVPERDLITLGVASCAELFGKYRKDGRMLRVLSTKGEQMARETVDPESALAVAFSIIAADLEALDELRKSPRARARIWVGDGRKGRSASGQSLEKASVALAVFSPPYLNHIDYTEVYKIELWLLGFVESQAEMLDLRSRTLRSHASIAVPTVKPRLPKAVLESVSTAANLLVRDNDSEWHDKTGPLAVAYLMDMTTTFEMLGKKLQPGARAVCVIGNSAHGTGTKRVVFGVDLWLARLAEAAGLDVEKVWVARPLVRRSSSPFLRESAIILRRPIGN